MELLEHIHNDVLKSLHFSITGHSQFEDDLYDFYDNLAESALFNQNHNIRFLIGSICELKNHNTWEVASYRQIFFKSFFYIDKIALLSFYFYSIRKLSETLLNGLHINASKTIAESFNRQINLRVSLTDYSKPFCKFDNRISVFEVRIPYSIFNKNIRDEIPELRDKLHDAIKQVDASKRAKQSNQKSKKGKIKRRYYSFENVTEDAKYEEFYNSVFDVNEVNRVFKELNAMFENDSRFATIIRNNSGIKNKELAASCIGIAFMCLYFNSSLEYFTGIAKIHQTGFDRTEQRNLGGIVVGYQKNQPLSKTERVIFGLIADKVTSVIAGQILVKESDEKDLRHKGMFFLKRYFDTHFDSLTHHNKIEIIDNVIDNGIIEFINGPLPKILSKSTTEKLSRYLKELKDADNRQAYIKENGERIKELIRFKTKDWADKLTEQFNVIHSITTNDVVYCDMNYLNGFIESSLINSNSHNPSNTTLTKSLSIQMYDMDNNITSDLEVSTEIHISIYDNGSGCDLTFLANGTTTISRLTKDIIDEGWKQTTNAFGEVELYSINKKVIFSPERQSPVDSDFCTGFKTILKLHKNSNA